MTTTHTEHGDSIAPKRADSNMEELLRRTKSVAEYIPKKYGFIRIRLKFLGMEVDVELLEIVSGLAVWVIWTDIVNLFIQHAYNNIYDLAFRLLSPTLWVALGSSLGLIHGISILLDKSCTSRPCPDPTTNEPCPLEFIQSRTICMALAFLYNFAITLSVVAAHSYTLVWKFMLLFSVASFWSHIRLRKQYQRLKKKQREGIASEFNTPR